MQIETDLIRVTPENLHLIQESLENYLETIEKEKELCIDSKENRQLLYLKSIDVKSLLYDVECVIDGLGIL